MCLFSRLQGVISPIHAEDGSPVSCMLDRPNEVETPLGRFVPKWQEDVRHKHIPALSFYPDGTLKTLYLEQQSLVKTPIGDYPAEFLTFYPSGALCRLFPVNGKISGYWSEEDESGLCPTLAFRLFCGAFRAKIISMHFYESGALRSLALWPGETVVLRTNIGVLPVRGGAAFYEDGSLDSAEPAHPLPVETPVGVITAYDTDAMSLHGDSNSLGFYPDGAMRCLVTSTDRVEVIAPGGRVVSFGPARRPDPLLDGGTVLLPLRIAFSGEEITLDNGGIRGTYSMTDCCFRTCTGSGDSTEGLRESPMSCGDCSSCNLCG